LGVGRGRAAAAPLRAAEGALWQRLDRGSASPGLPCTQTALLSARAPAALLPCSMGLR
jgi:hypothetical protein